MADTYNRLTSNGGRPVPEMGSTTPGIEYSESERPAVGLLPAPYLPVQRFDDHKRANIVLSAGIPVGFDNRGYLVPAGIPGGHVFTYSALDYQTGQVATTNPADPGTGGVAVSAAGDVTMASGLADVGKFVRPIGVVSYNVYSHEGGMSGFWPTEYTLNYDNPYYYGQWNTMAQDLVAVTCDYVLNVPYIYDRNLLAATSKIIDNTANEVALLSDSAKSYPFAHDELVGTQTALSGAHTVVFVSPDCGHGDNGGGTGASGVLTFTGVPSTFTFAWGTTDGRQALAGSSVLISSVGYHVLYSADPSKYIVVKTESGKQTGGATGNITLALQTDLVPGDHVVCRLGKFVKYDYKRHEPDEIIGQVLRVDKNAIQKDYLNRVKTAYERSANVTHRMAGSATRGVPYLLHLVSDGAQVQLETKKTLSGSALNATGLPTSAPLAMVVINMTK